MQLALGRNWHKECFICDTCRVPLDAIFYPSDEGQVGHIHIHTYTYTHIHTCTHIPPTHPLSPPRFTATNTYGQPFGWCVQCVRNQSLLAMSLRWATKNTTLTIFVVLFVRLGKEEERKGCQSFSFLTTTLPQKKLANAEYYEREGKPYCKRDYIKLFG